MSVFGKPFAVAVGAVALSGTAMVPLATALASSSAEAHQLSQSAAAETIVTPVALPAAPAPVEAIVIERPAAPEAGEAEDAPAPARPETQVVDAELTCLAKVVVHEAGNQSRAGQLAVAQVVMNRVNDPRGRFGRTICGVVMQRGQFFNVHAYNPPRNARWWRAVDVAREARDGDSDQVVHGALFFHAANAGISWGGRRTRLARVGDHVFYR